MSFKPEIMPRKLGLARGLRLPWKYGKTCSSRVSSAGNALPSPSWRSRAFKSAYAVVPSRLACARSSAPNPGWLFRASLASCTTTAIAMRAAMLGLRLTTLEVTVESTADVRGNLGLDDAISAGLSSLTTRVKIGAAGVPEDQLRQLVQWGEIHSPMTCTVRNSPAYSLVVDVV